MAKGIFIKEITPFYLTLSTKATLWGGVVVSGICRFRYAEPRQSFAIKDCSREPVGFFTVPHKVTTKKATLWGGVVVTLSGLEPEFAP